MQTDFCKNSILACLIYLLGSCSTSEVKTTTANNAEHHQNYFQTSQANSHSLNKNIFEYVFSTKEFEQKANYKKAAQFLCQVKDNFSKAKELFDKSLHISNNNDMAQTFFLYSECLYKHDRKVDALKLMKKADKFRANYLIAKLRLAEMYFEKKSYEKCHKEIYSMKNNKWFFNNERVLKLRLKLAECMHHKNEAAKIRLIFSSRNFNDDKVS